MYVKFYDQLTFYCVIQKIKQSHFFKHGVVYYSSLLLPDSSNLHNGTW